MRDVGSEDNMEYMRFDSDCDCADPAVGPNLEPPPMLHPSLRYHGDILPLKAVLNDFCWAQVCGFTSSCFSTQEIHVRAVLLFVYYVERNTRR